MKTKVIFRKYRHGTPEVVALFPELPEDLRGYHLAIYQHTVQHGGGDRMVMVDITRPATPEESAPLKRELEAIGYDLEVRRKITPAMDRARMDAARRH